VYLIVRYLVVFRGRSLIAKSKIMSNNFKYAPYRKIY